LAAADVRASNVKWLTPRAFGLWKRVGLLGFGPDEVPDEAWRGRNDGRDAAFAEVLFCSGLRRREAGTLLTVELPDTTVPRRFYSGQVAAAVAKHAQRYFYVSASALQAVQGYRASTRAQAVARARAEGRYEALRVRWMVQHIGRSGVLRWVDTDGAVSEASLNALTDVDRQRLYVEGEAGVEPLALWLTEAGLPMGYRSWSHVSTGPMPGARRWGCRCSAPRICAGTLSLLCDRVAIPCVSGHTDHCRPRASLLVAALRATGGPWPSRSASTRTECNTNATAHGLCGDKTQRGGSVAHDRVPEGRRDDVPGQPDRLG
jgi:hypothetical protein